MKKVFFRDALSLLAFLTALAVMLVSCGAEDVRETDTACTFDTETADTAERVTESETEDTSVTETDPPETHLPDETPERSLLAFLKIAAMPVGSTMYIWGGGWNEEDTGAGIEAVTLGVSGRWSEFASMQDKNYDYKTTRYQIHDGLDCSGYIGWAVYNVLEDESGREGYVLSSTKMASHYAGLGLGDFTEKNDVTDWRAGDIMSMKGHAWIAVGTCADGSVLMLHSSPPGVIFCGTSLADGGESDAVRLSESLMSEHFPDWYAKYPKCSRPYSYLTDSSSMRWHSDVLSDDEGLYDMTADEIAKLIFDQ